MLIMLLIYYNSINRLYYVIIIFDGDILFKHTCMLLNVLLQRLLLCLDGIMDSKYCDERW